MRVRYRQLNNDNNNDDDEDTGLHSDGWKEISVTSESTSTVIDGLATDGQYSILVDASNEVGYNTSLTAERIVIPDANSGT